MKPQESQDLGPDILAKAAKSASYGIGLQFTFRASTFLVNLFLVRYISKDVLGVVNVRLSLLYTTVFLLTSEPFIRAGLSKTEKRCWSQTVNLLWCSFPFGIFWALICGFLWMYVLEQPDPSVIPHYNTAVVCYSVSAIVEMLCLPLLVIAQLMMFVEAKAVIEGIALVVQCFLTITLVILVPHWGLVTFSIAQLLYTFTITTLYYGYFTRQLFRRRRDHTFPFRRFLEFLPSRLKDKPFVDNEQRGLLLSFAKQSFFKQILTEGEKYVMTLFNVLTFADQGVYTVVSNLGSLVVRIVFLPMEDGLYLFIAQNLQRGIPIKQQPKEQADLTGRVLAAVLRVRVLLGLVIATYGFSYSSLALEVLYGEKFSRGAGPQLLSWVAFYVLLVSVNGITEGFKNATMSQKQVDRYSRVMLCFSLAFLGSSLILTKYFGIIGFVLSNCINMCLRIFHSAYFIYQYFKDSSYQPVWNHFPSVAMTVSFFVALSFTASSEFLFGDKHQLKFQLIHVGVGFACLLFNVLVFVVFERPLIKYIYGLCYKDKDMDKKS